MVGRQSQDRTWAALFQSLAGSPPQRYGGANVHTCIHAHPCTVYQVCPRIAHGMTTRPCRGCPAEGSLLDLVKEIGDFAAYQADRPPFHALIVTVKVPRGAMYRYYDTRGRLVVYMNRTDFEYMRAKMPAPEPPTLGALASVWGVQVRYE